MVRAFIATMAVVLCLVACAPTTANDLAVLTTPKIQHFENGHIESDRLLMIPFNDKQLCSEALNGVSRFNPRTLSIESCNTNTWHLAFVHATNAKKTAGCAGHKIKKKKHN